MTVAPTNQEGWIRVWDPLVRLFHWGTVAAVATAFLSEDSGWLHEDAGYVVLGLLAFRLIWGLVGTPYARFASFMVGPAEVRGYLGSLWHRRARRYLGHNPAGGLMIAVLLALLLLTAGSGWLMTTDRFWGVGWVEDVHETLANLLLAASCIHVLGALVSSVLHRENLVLAMITGRKRAQLPDAHG